MLQLEKDGKDNGNEDGDRSGHSLLRFRQSK